MLVDDRSQDLVEHPERHHWLTADIHHWRRTRRNFRRDLHHPAGLAVVLHWLVPSKV